MMANRLCVALGCSSSRDLIIISSCLPRCEAVQGGPLPRELLLHECVLLSQLVHLVTMLLRASKDDTISNKYSIQEGCMYSVNRRGA